MFTATVLQHNTDEDMLIKLMNEIARVSKERVVIFEKIDSQIKGDELCLGRPIGYYAAIMQQCGFQLQSTKLINIRTSFYLCGAIRKGLNPKERNEWHAQIRE